MRTINWILLCLISGCVQAPDQETEPVIVSEWPRQVKTKIPSGWSSPSMCFGSDWLSAFTAIKRCNPRNERILLKFISARSITQLGGEDKTLQWLSAHDFNMQKRLVAVQESDTEYFCSYVAVVKATQVQFSIRLAKGDTLRLILPITMPQ